MYSLMMSFRERESSESRDDEMGTFGVVGEDVLLNEGARKIGHTLKLIAVGVVKFLKNELLFGIKLCEGGLEAELADLLFLFAFGLAELGYYGWYCDLEGLVK